MNEFSQAISDNGLTLVDFYATWCGPCKMMHPVLEQLKADMGDQVNIVKIDVDMHEDLSARYSVQSIPTLLLFRAGQVLWRQTGVTTLSALKSVIRQHL